MTVGYLCAIGIALVFMLYMDGTIGVMMLSFLLLMPLISAVMTLLVRRRLRITLELPDSVPKHQKITAVLKLEKDTILPLPFLRLRLTADAHFDPLNPEADPLPEKPSEETLGPLRYQIEYRRYPADCPLLRRRQADGRCSTAFRLFRDVPVQNEGAGACGSADPAGDP